MRAYLGLTNFFIEKWNYIWKSILANCRSTMASQSTIFAHCVLVAFSFCVWIFTIFWCTGIYILHKNNIDMTIMDWNAVIMILIVLKFEINMIDTFGTSLLSHLGIGMAVESSSHPQSLNLHEHRSICPSLDTKHHLRYMNIKFQNDKYQYMASRVYSCRLNLIF